MRLGDNRCVWDIIWLQNTIGFQGIYKERDGK